MARVRGGGWRWLLMWLPPLGALLVFACIYVVLHAFYDPFAWFNRFTAGSPHWSPDGRQVVFRCGQNDLYEGGVCVRQADRDGRRMIQPWQGFWSGTDVAWSPDGKKILCSGFGVRLINPDGTGEKELAPSGHNAAWPPDSRQIAWCASGGICVMNADGSGKRQLLSVNGDSYLSAPRWSPDGKRLLYQKDPADFRGSSALYIISVDGHSPSVRLGDGSNAVWSPDGRQIAFSYGGIYLMNADGSHCKRLTNAYNSGTPRFSPTGRHLVFVGNGNKLYLLSLDEGSPQAVGIGYDPAFSPDGRRLAFVGQNCPPGASGIRVVALRSR